MMSFFRYLVNLCCSVLVVESCPLLWRLSSVESSVGLDFELGVLVRALMLKVLDKNEVPGPYDLNALFKTREEGSLRGLPVKDCGFGKGLAKYLGVGGAPHQSLFLSACKKFIIAIVLEVGNVMSSRMDQCWSTAMLHPTMMKYGSIERLGEMMLLCLSKFCDREKIAGAVRGRVEAAFVEVVTASRKKWETDVGAPVVDDIVKFWCGLDSWKKYKELYYVISTLLSSACHGRYAMDFLDVGWPIVGDDDVLGPIHCVRSWFARDGGTFHHELSSAVVRKAVESIVMSARFQDPSLASPWTGLTKFSRRTLWEKFSAKWNGEQSLSVGVSQDEYRSELLQEFHESRVSPKKSVPNRPANVTGGGKKQKRQPKVQSELVLESASTSASGAKKVRIDEVSVASTSKRVDFAIVSDKDKCLKKK